MSGIDYSQLTDEKVIAKIKEGDQDAIEYLLDKYKYIVRKKANALFLIGGEKEDLIQEGMIGLYKAIRDFSADKDSSFYNFADLCISRQIYSAINASNRKKNIPLNTYISLYAPLGAGDSEESEDHPPLLDTMYVYREQNPESLVIDKENTGTIERELHRCLSPLEDKVLELYMNGMKYVQIAKVLGKDPKSIDNALQRIKTKLNQVLKKI